LQTKADRDQDFDKIENVSNLDDEEGNQSESSNHIPGDLQDRGSRSLSNNDDEIDNSENNQSLNSMDKVQTLLEEINDTCIQFLKNDDIDSAIDCLKRAE